MTITLDEPRVWISSLRDYNEGKLEGIWLNLSDYTDQEEVLEAIQDFLTQLDNQELQDRMGEDPLYVNPLPFQPREEWVVHDFEGFPKRFYSENMDFSEVLAHLEEVRELDESEREAYELYVANAWGNTTVERFRDAYRGKYNSMEEYAEELFEDIYDIPSYLSSYIDYERVARDLLIDGYWEEGGHVFTNE